MPATISDSFIPVSVSTLSSSVTLGMNLFRPSEQQGKYQLYREASYPFTDSDLIRLRERGISQLFIQQQDRETYQQYLRDLAFQASGESKVPISARAQALGSVVRDVLAGAFERRDGDETVSLASELGFATANIVCEDAFAASDLSRVLNHDYATFTHSTNVALYAGILAKQLGYQHADVQLITTGGLLHDFGKLEIDEKILRKPGRLDEVEFRAVRRHPTSGFVQLAGREDLTEGQLMMVYQHHERIDGTGYPVGLVDQEIHPWAKLCAVVDVFEALTSHRPYRSPMPKKRAIELMQRDAGQAFEPEILECWVEITQSYWHA